MASFESNLPKVLEALGDAERDTLFMIGKLIEDAAKHLAPVGEIHGGTLRQSIASRVGRLDGEPAVIIGTNVEYALYVEKGTGVHAADGNGRKTAWRYYDPKTDTVRYTRGMKPQPFLTPAARDEAPRIEAIVKEVYGKLNR